MFRTTSDTPVRAKCRVFLNDISKNRNVFYIDRPSPDLRLFSHAFIRL